jgi:hypothetical protein
MNWFTGSTNLSGTTTNTEWMEYLSSKAQLAKIQLLAEISHPNSDGNIAKFAYL